MSNIIYHYTSIETFKKIYKSKKVRFNRLDKVDDISEGKSFKKIKLEQFFYISCWTKNSKESIPQWNLYTPNMKGVRIGIYKNMFKKLNIIYPANEKLGSRFESPLLINEIFGNNYIILPMFLNRMNFCREVEYDDNFETIKNEAIKIQINENKKVKIEIKDPMKIASVKRTEWLFQDEIRYILFVIPSNCKNYNEFITKNLYKELPNILIKALMDGIGPNVDYIDIPLNDLILNNIEITMGPKCTENDRAMVNEIIEENKSIQIRNSIMTGMIRDKQ